MASLFTGLQPSRHGAGRVTNRRDPLGRSPLPADSWTIATALRAAGYRTHAIVTNPYLTLRYGFGDGFESYENLTVESEVYVTGRRTAPLRLFAWLAPGLVPGDRGGAVSARATRWLGGVERSRPFFLWLHYVDPHAPYQRPGTSRHKSFRGDSLLGAQSASEALPLELSAPDVGRLRSGELRLSDAERDGVRALYRAEVAAVDLAVGTVLDALDDLGLARDTLVVCLSDHGEELWEHGGIEHGHSVYDEVVRIPLLMRWPGRLPRGARVPALARTVDVVPTVVELLGLDAAPATDGRSLLAALRGEEAEPPAALIENLLFAEERVAMRSATTKYVRWATGKDEAYDLRADPREQRDLAGVPAVVGAQRARFDAQRRAAPSELAAPAAPAGGNVAGLRALGYLQ
jgi:arylsulfatase A-like enzyme